MKQKHDLDPKENDWMFSNSVNRLKKINSLHTISVLSNCSSQSKTKGLQRNKEKTEKLKEEKYPSFVLKLNTN